MNAENRQLIKASELQNISFVDVLVLQVMDSLCQLSQSKRLDRVPSLLEVHDCGPGNSGLARQ